MLVEVGGRRLNVANGSAIQKMDQGGVDDAGAK